MPSDWWPTSPTPQPSRACSTSWASGGTGELNILINAVGPSAAGTFEDLTDDEWRQAVDDGVMGMVHCVRSALPLLRKADWARIVNFSAHSTQRQSVILPAYTAAKSMLTSISKNLSLLLAKDEIMVNVVCIPGHRKRSCRPRRGPRSTLFTAGLGSSTTESQAGCGRLYR